MAAQLDGSRSYILELHQFINAAVLNGETKLAAPVQPEAGPTEVRYVERKFEDFTAEAQESVKVLEVEIYNRLIGCGYNKYVYVATKLNPLYEGDLSCFTEDENTLARAELQKMCVEVEEELGLGPDGAGAADAPLPQVIPSLSSSMAFRDFSSEEAAAAEKSEAELWKAMPRSDVVKGVIAKVEGRSIMPPRFSIMAFFADEGIQRKYPRRFGCFKKTLSSQMTEARVETFFSSAKNAFPAIKKGMKSEKLSQKLLCKHGEKRYPTEAPEIQAVYKRRRSDKAASAFAAKQAREAAQAAAVATPGAADMQAAVAAVAAVGGVAAAAAAMAPVDTAAVEE